MQNSKFKIGWSYAFFIGICILVLAVFLRTYNIFSIPIFADEAIYIRWAQVMRAESSLRFLPLSDGKQPLFMWMAIPFLKIFSDPLIAGRMLSVATGITSLVGVSLITYRLFNSTKAALLAALFYAVSPFTVFFDRIGLVDSMLSMFGIWSFYFAVLTAQTFQLSFAMLTGFALGGALLTKSPAIFFVLLLPTTAVLSPWPKTIVSRLGALVRLLGLWVTMLVIGFGMQNIQRLGPNFHMLGLRSKDYVFPISQFWTNPFDPLQSHLREILEWFWVLLPGATIVLSVIWVFFGFRRWWREILVLGAWTVVPLLVQAELAKVFTARYLLFTTFPLLVMASMGVLSIEKKSRRVAWLSIAAVFFPALWFNWLILTDPEKAPLPRVERSGYLEEWTAGTGIREVASYIKNEKMKNSQTIVVGTEGFFGTLPDGLQIYLSDIPGVVVKGVGISISEVDSSLIQAKKAGDKVFLVVNSSRLAAEPTRIGLELIASYPKAKRLEGTREYSVNGPQDFLYLLEVTDEAINIFNTKN